MAQIQECPSCGQLDMVQKVSAIYEAGRSTMEYRSWMPPPPRSALPPLLVTSDGAVQSSLSRRFSPPKKPDKSSALQSVYPVGTRVVLALGVLLIAAVFYAIKPELGIVAGLACWLLAYFGVTAPANQKAKTLLQAEEARSSAAIQEWNAAYYCARDDLVFIPGSGRTYTPSAFEALLRMTA